jgi:hypothetical protein
MPDAESLMMASLYFFPPALVFIPARHVAILICIYTATIDGWRTTALDADAAVVVSYNAANNNRRRVHDTDADRR